MYITNCFDLCRVHDWSPTQSARDLSEFSTFTWRHFLLTLYTYTLYIVVDKIDYSDYDLHMQSL